ncbi:MAG: geranylgeranyl reductase family protein [Nanoarchaeota archaeon]
MRKKDDTSQVCIIGAGPIGLYTAYLLARSGHAPYVLEEHDTIGLPVQCTGLLTQDILEYFDPVPGLLNTISGIRLHIEGQDRPVELASKEYVVDRAAFDQSLAAQAESAGASIIKGVRYTGTSKGNVTWEEKFTGKTCRRRCRILIGADGPGSKVRQQHFPQNAATCLTGIQVRVDVKLLRQKYRDRIRSDTYEVFFGDMFPGFFGWIVPENKRILRIGCASSNGAKRIHKRFLKHVLEGDQKSLPSSCYQAGRIPLYDPHAKVMAQDKHMSIFLIGDAAGQVKATTGGGIVPGLRAATDLAAAIDRIIAGSAGSAGTAGTEGVKGTGATYSNSLLQVHNRSLLYHLIARRTLDSFREEDYHKLSSILSTTATRRILAQVSRDRISLLVLRMVRANPGMLAFLPRVLAASWKSLF